MPSLTPGLKIPIIPVGGAKPVAPYTPAIMTNGMVASQDSYARSIPHPIPGLTARDMMGAFRDPGDVAAQTRYILDQIALRMEGTGHSLQHVVATRIQMESMSDYGAINKVYGSYDWGENPPAREAVAVGALPLGDKVRISGVAMFVGGDMAPRGPISDVPSRLDISGQIALTSDSTELQYPEDVILQCRLAMNNLKGLLAAAGGDLSCLSSARIYITQAAHFSSVQRLIATEHSQLIASGASISFQVVAGLPLGAVFEIAGTSETIPARTA